MYNKCLCTHWSSADLIMKKQKVILIQCLVHNVQHHRVIAKPTKSIATHPNFFASCIDFSFSWVPVIPPAQDLCHILSQNWVNVIFRVPCKINLSPLSLSGGANMPAFSANAYLKFNNTFTQSLLCVQCEPVVMVTSRDINQYRSRQRRHWQQ